MNKIEYIARGIICRKDKILLCKDRAQGHYYLPGGHIEDGETSEGALKREMVEESGNEIIATEFVVTIENEFEQSGREVREQFDVHLARLDDANSVASREEHIGFDWVPVAQLHSVSFLPQKIVPDIVDIIEKNRSFWKE